MRNEAKIPYDVIKAGRAFADKVHIARAGNKDKFLQGDEAKADRIGFQVEFAHCHVFGQPFPKELKGKEVDEFDSMLVAPNEDGLLQQLKFDVKTSRELLINKDQFDRKKVDAYIFEDLNFLDYSTGAIFLRFHGWILKSDVKENSELVEFENGSKAYKLKPGALKSPRLLGALKQPEWV